MIQIIVMSIFCIVLLVYGYGVVFKKEWLMNLIGGNKTKHDEQSNVMKLRSMMGMASLVFGILGLIINVVTAFVLFRGGAL